MRALEGESSTSLVEKEIWADSVKFRFPATICGFFFLRRHMTCPDARGPTLGRFQVAVEV